MDGGEYERLWKCCLGDPMNQVHLLHRGFWGSCTNFVQRVFWMALGIICILSAYVWPVKAQAGGGSWSDPVDLAQPTEFTTLAMIPKMTADIEGNVHVVFGAWLGPDPAEKFAPNVVFYTMWNGSDWTPPMDVLSAESDQTLAINGIATTADGQVVVAWSSDNQIFVSYAPINLASIAREWQTEVVTLAQQVTNVALAVDQNSDRWYVTYVYGTCCIATAISDDKGESWSDKTIWTAETRSVAPNAVNMTVAADGGAHIVWSEANAERNWTSVAIWHARVSEKSDYSAEVREVSRSGIDGPTQDWPMIVAGKNKGIHIFWSNGIGSTTGRFHQWSEDNGATWSAVENVFVDDLSGQTGYAGAAYDSAGRLHVITSAYSKRWGTDLVLRHAIWANGVWSDYTNLWQQQEYESEHPSLVITQGNRLHLLWREERYNMIAYAALDIDAPMLPDQVFSTDSTLGNIVTLSQTAPVSMPLPVVEPTPSIDFDRNASPNDPASPTLVWLASLLPVLCLILAAIAGSLKNRERR